MTRRRGWELVGTFTDDGRGAYRDDAKRPAWEAMLDAKPDVIVVRDVERLGRHPREYVALLNSKAKVVEWMDEETAEVRWEADPVNPGLAGDGEAGGVQLEGPDRDFSTSATEASSSSPIDSALP